MQYLPRCTFFVSHLGITSEMVEATLAGDHRLVLPLEKEHFFCAEGLILSRGKRQTAHKNQK
jgi:hypothetical protein